MTNTDEKFYRAEVTKRVDVAPDLWIFRIRSSSEFNFVPGQYASLSVEVDGKRIERPYSIASSPSEDEVEFFFELVPNGALTPLLYKLQVGDPLLMRKIPKEPLKNSPIHRLSVYGVSRGEKASATTNTGGADGV